jgi:hypothetical protein
MHQRKKGLISRIVWCPGAQFVDQGSNFETTYDCGIERVNEPLDKFFLIARRCWLLWYFRHFAFDFFCRRKISLKVALLLWPSSVMLNCCGRLLQIECQFTSAIHPKWQYMCTCLGSLGGATTNRILSIYFMAPKDQSK